MIEPKLKEWIDAHFDELLQDLFKLVNIRSVSDVSSGTPDAPYGKGCKKALLTGMEIAKAKGFEIFNHENQCATALWKGESDDEIGLFGHLDVVPEGTGWNYDPYNAVIKDDIVIGRGVWDNKGPTVASLYAVKYLKDSGIKLKHSVRMFMGSNEECGMSDVIYYTRHNKMPVFSLVPDVNFPTCYGEKGMFRTNVSCDISGGKLLEFGSGQVPNMFPAAAYVVVAEPLEVVEKALKGKQGDDFNVETIENKTRINARGKASHACLPEESDSAMVKLARLLSQVDLLDVKSKAACKFLADAFENYYGAGFNVDFRDDTGRLTLCGGMTNITNGILTQRIDIRYPVKTTARELTDNMTEVCRQGGFSMEILENDPPVGMSKDSPIVKMLDSTCNDVLKKNYEPYVLGFTYARKLKNAVAYGPGQNDWEKKMPAGFGGAHQPDEYIPLQGLKDAVAVYATVLPKLDAMI
jgi:succinyl-diaminopimelate desuccinylase